MHLAIIPYEPVTRIGLRSAPEFISVSVQCSNSSRYLSERRARQRELIRACFADKVVRVSNEPAASGSLSADLDP